MCRKMCATLSDQKNAVYTRVSVSAGTGPRVLEDFSVPGK